MFFIYITIWRVWINLLIDFVIKGLLSLCLFSYAQMKRQLERQEKKEQRKVKKKKRNSYLPEIDLTKETSYYFENGNMVRAGSVHKLRLLNEQCSLGCGINRFPYN